MACVTFSTRTPKFSMQSPDHKHVQLVVNYPLHQINSTEMHCKSYIIHKLYIGQDFPGGANTWGGAPTYYLTNFSRKLHKSGRPPPPRSVTGTIFSENPYIIKEILVQAGAPGTPTHGSASGLTLENQTLHTNKQANKQSWKNKKKNLF